MGPNSLDLENVPSMTQQQNFLLIDIICGQDSSWDAKVFDIGKQLILIQPLSSNSPLSPKKLLLNLVISLPSSRSAFI
jgi:hypothetical protein